MRGTRGPPLGLVARRPIPSRRARRGPGRKRPRHPRRAQSRPPCFPRRSNLSPTPARRALET
eukprot:9328373-Pyramimonas_sp.AAC.1